MPNTETLAIRTGNVFTAVTVDSEAGQCLVARADGEGRLYVSGLTERAIKSAAQDGAGRGYKTLRGLMTDYPHAQRRTDLDC